MFELMTMTMSPWGCLTTQAASKEAGLVCEAIRETRGQFQKTETFGFVPRNVLEDLEKIRSTCSEEGWDGFDATPISDSVIQQAKAFLSTMPLDMHPIDVSPEPDGHISFEWYRATTRVLSVSVSPSGDMHYAAIIGPAKSYGTEPFTGVFPCQISGLIDRIFAL